MQKYQVGDTVYVIDRKDITWDPNDKPLGWDTAMYDRCGKKYQVTQVNKLDSYVDADYSYVLNDPSPQNDGWHFKWLDIYLRPAFECNIDDNALFDFL